MTYHPSIKAVPRPGDINPDIALWTRFRDGNQEALAQLYIQHVPALHKHGMSVGKDSELVNDCIHELFSRLWTRRERIGVAQNVRVYLFKSLERIIVAQLLRRRKLSGGFEDAEGLSSESSEQLWIDGEMKKERLSEIKKCLRSLPKCQREVILLKFFNDLTYGEISEIMDMQVASVYNLASKAIEQLRQKLQSPGDHPGQLAMAS